jgi:hypothetical protein
MIRRGLSGEIDKLRCLICPVGIYFAIIKLNVEL